MGQVDSLLQRLSRKLQPAFRPCIAARHSKRYTCTEFVSRPIAPGPSTY